MKSENQGSRRGTHPNRVCRIWWGNVSNLSFPNQFKSCLTGTKIKVPGRLRVVLQTSQNTSHRQGFAPKANDSV